jgi:hypothetical protein
MVDEPGGRGANVAERFRDHPAHPSYASLIGARERSSRSTGKRKAEAGSSEPVLDREGAHQPLHGNLM